MHSSDLACVRAWRNHPDVRRYMYTTHEISEPEHAAWFLRASKDPRMSLLIYERDQRPLGFVNLTRGRTVAVADWGFYIAPDAPRGTGRALGRKALLHAFSALELHKVCGQALGFNQRSMDFHRALGFSEEGRLRDQHFDGNQFWDVVCFGLLKQEWLELNGECNHE